MTRWTIFSLCLLVLLASLAWTTRRMLRMEQQGREAVAEAEFQERVRLALWRLDAATNPILIRENARPPHHYRAFHSGGEIFSSSYSRSNREPCSAPRHCWHSARRTSGCTSNRPRPGNR